MRAISASLTRQKDGVLALELHAAGPAGRFHTEDDHDFLAGIDPLLGPSPR
jgi:hypothetical protein